MGEKDKKLGHKISKHRKTKDRVKKADCRRGQSLVVWAISEGRQAARAVDVYLSGKSALPGPGGVIGSY
ncbi:hypothetical protein MSG28_007761 [Choristoneura fumiferana]|uniref:Uncharacterized protein n=1 Tax=Choristoneura fumiferana TaxID=7141 RepID=A0ACC0JZ13_CHOFU|nr:hypothetical protein MSG28_007761 [Choristoneura fumiferana]